MWRFGFVWHCFIYTVDCDCGGQALQGVRTRAKSDTPMLQDETLDIIRWRGMNVFNLALRRKVGDLAMQV